MTNNPQTPDLTITPSKSPREQKLNTRRPMAEHTRWSFWEGVENTTGFVLRDKRTGLRFMTLWEDCHTRPIQVGTHLKSPLSPKTAHSSWETARIVVNAPSPMVLRKNWTGSIKQIWSKRETGFTCPQREVENRLERNLPTA